MLYMFQAVSLPIIKSSKLYTQHRVFQACLLLPLVVAASNLEILLAVAASKLEIPNAVCTVLSS